MAETAPEAPQSGTDSPSNPLNPVAGEASTSALTSRNVTHVEIEGRDVYIVGTAHVSPKSVEEVTRVIREVKPDTVCVELDAMRHEALVDENRWRKLDIFAVIRQQKVLFLLSSLVLSSYQRRMGDKLGVKPGAELHAAVREADALGAHLVLADRDIQATLKRTWGNLSFFNKLKVLAAMNAAFFGSAEIDEEQIEELKDRDVINEMMHEFAQAMPQVQVPLIDERDRFLMTKIADAPGKKIVAVVGAGHVQGMLHQLGKQADLE
ncbi:MAG: TraB family protein [Myxococcales bacterium]|nr:TraB family protein [Myxococcales bacterium]